MYKQEVKSINRLVDGHYNPVELTNDRDPLKNTRRYATKRLDSYRRYLSDKVGESFFEEVGPARDFAKTE